jgi:hypothetical protein
MQDKRKFILTLDVTKRCNYLLTELTRRLVLKKLLSNLFMLLLISYAAKAQRTEGHLLSESEV